MFSSLARIRAPRTDDANIVASFNVGHNQYASSRGQSDDQQPLFVLGVVRIGNRDRLPVSKDSHCFVEADSMPPDIRRSLPRIPLEVHGVMLPGTGSGDEKASRGDAKIA